LSKRRRVGSQTSNNRTVFFARRSATVRHVRWQIIGVNSKRFLDAVSYFLLQLVAPWVLLSHLLQAWRLLQRSHAQPLVELYASHETELSLGDTRGEDGDVARPP
jgi:hypothetical protein